MTHDTDFYQQRTETTIQLYDKMPHFWRGTTLKGSEVAVVQLNFGCYYWGENKERIK